MSNFNFWHRSFLLLLLGLGLLTRAQAQIVLPIEVLGPEGTTERISLPVTDASQVAALYLRVHRPGFRAASTDPAVRASVRINGSNWVDLTNANVEALPIEASYGGIGGGFLTVRFKMAASKFGGAFVAGANTLSVRLNQTDGHSSGVRVLEVNLLDAGGAKLLPASAFAYDDPKKWTAPRSSAADVAEGQRLWNEAVLKESPLASGSIRATCSGCHHVRGLDLKYFNYSNHAIVERTKFHGLSQAQGEQIASYIRGIVLKKRDGTTFEAPGLPWNPVYQPGPGLDSKPVEFWSAGAGLDAVLEKDSDIIPHLFPKGTSLAALKEVTSSKATLNMRELPIAIQLPDWNEWCTPHHPLDIWGDHFYDSEAWKDYQRVRQEMAGGPNSVSKEQALTLMQEFTDDAITQSLNRDGYRQSRREGISEEDAVIGMRRWAITKIWELNQDFQLDDLAPQLYPKGGERGWIGRARSVFELAPHLSGKNGEQFAYQDHKVGKYFSTAWYHLQAIVNPGYRDNVVHIPIDWKYHFSHIENLTNWFDETPGEGMRFAASQIKSMQMWDNDYGVKDSRSGWNLREIWPETLVSSGFDKLFRDVSPELRRNLAEAFYSSWYAKTSAYPVADFERWSLNPDGTAKDFDSYPWPPSNFPYPVTEALKGYAEIPTRVRDMIVYGRKAGIDGTLLNNIADFGKAMWPLWDFDQLKVEGTPPPAVSLRAADNPANAVAGLDYAYYQGSWSKLPDFASLTAAKTGTVTTFDLSPRTQDDNFAFQYKGYVDVPADGEYTFYTSSDDGSRLYIGSTLVVDNDGLHGSQEKSGKIGLKQGKHALTVAFFEATGGEELVVSYAGPSLSKTAIPAAALFRAGSTPTPTPTSSLRAPENPAGAVAGLDYAYYQGSWDKLPDFAALTAVKTGTVTNFDLSPRTQDDNFGFQYKGYVDIPADGEYTFSTTSDDGSRLYIGSTLVVDNDGLHGAVEKSGKIGLQKGQHALTVVFFERTGGQSLSVSYQSASLSKALIPAAALLRVGSAAATPAPAPAPTAATSDYEAEKGTWGGGGGVQDASAASGGQLVGNLNALGAYSQVGGVAGGSGGTATVVVRYANGYADSRSLSLYANGSFVSRLSFAPTGGWNTFATVSASVSLAAGAGNTLKLQRDDADLAAADVDKYTVTTGAAAAKAAKAAALRAEASAKAARPGPAPEVGSVYPNPLPGGVGTLRYVLEREQPVGWALYDGLGRVVRASDYVRRPAGAGEQVLDLSRLAPGAYWLHLTVGTHTTRQQLRLQ